MTSQVKAELSLQALLIWLSSCKKGNDLAGQGGTEPAGSLNLAVQLHEKNGALRKPKEGMNAFTILWYF